MNKIIIVAIIIVSILSLLVFLGIQPESQKQTQSVPTNNSQIKESDIQVHDAESILLLCELDEHCMIEALQEISKQQDEQTMYDTISDLMYQIDQDGFYCHPQGHHIGSFLYAHTQDLEQALSIADRKCGGSMYHGIVETYFMSEIFFEKTNFDDVQIKDSCDQLADSSQSLYFECVHGIGHGLVKAYGDIFPAVARCDEFETQEEQIHCQQGVFMENVIEFTSTDGGVFDEDDLLYPCNKMELKYAESCYYYHTSYILTKTNSISESFEQCDKITNEKQIQSCYQGIGRQLVVNTPFKDLINYCQTGNPEYHKFCFRGIMIVVLDHLSMDTGFQACNNYPEKFQAECFFNLGSWISHQNLSREQIVEECNKAGEKYYNVCLQSALN
jgi:hypothetical protein